MKREQKEVLEDISKIQKNQGLLIDKAKTYQQQFFQVFAQRKLLNNQMLHKHIEEVLEYLPGSFASSALYDFYLSVCLELRVELDPEQHPILKRLIEWSDSFSELKKQRILPLLDTVAPEQNNQTFDDYEAYLSFINLVAGDLVKLIRGPSKPMDEYSEKYLKAVDPDDLIAFLMGSLPKILYNIILPNEVLPPEQKRENQSMEILYRVPSFEYFLRSKTSYGTLMKILVKMLMNFQLKQSQQKLMMELVFRYFYAYHHDKRYGATDIFIEAYNNLNQSVRFALADQFVLFLKIVRKIGKHKFVEFLLNKSQWLKEINSKVSTDNYVGYVKQTLSPFPGFRIPDVIKIPNGKIESRWFEILQDFSLFYFVIEIPTKDITLRLFYLGDFTSEKPVRTELLSCEKKSGVVKANIMAVKRGIYMFEFDNSYSWINSKTVKFQKIVLAPVQFQSVDQHSWLSSFYDNIPLNKMGDKNQVIQIKKVMPPKPEISYEGVANISKVNGFYNLKLGKGTDMYEFQTESEDKLVEKFTELVEKSGKIKWMIAGEPLEETGDLKKLLEQKNKSSGKEEEKKEVRMVREVDEKEKVEVEVSSTALTVEKESQQKHQILKEQREVLKEEKELPKEESKE